MRKHLSDQKLLDYASSLSMTSGRVGRQVIEDTARRYPDLSRMQIDPLQGAFLALLVKLIGATRLLEIGTFTGLSSLSMAQALPEGGTLVCCDLSEEFTNHAKRAWEEAGVADRITLLIGPALQTLEDLEGPFDMAFLDADKPNYPAYLRKLTELVRPGGVIVADNTLWSGRVIDPGDRTEATDAIRRFNDLAASSPDLEVVVLPFADGVTLMRRC
ncbi:MAG: class I SAM-dependent methyltransferase [bacterium]|nr:class I SAM-dependent methyltransferase [bacterium]MDE0602333.1 class I SAM-dependent methyltransferase [bacterium]